MSKKNIKFVQNLLKNKNKYGLALKLENSYYTLEHFSEFNEMVSATAIIYINSNNYFDFLELDEDDKELIKLSLNALTHTDYNYIGNIEFKIDVDIEIDNFDDIVYIFVDESGNRDFTAKGSKYFMFNFLIKKRPFNLHSPISNYRYTLLEKNLDPLKGNDRRLNIESFHACKDNKYIREEIFNIISTFDEKFVKAYSYILEKPKVNPDMRNQKDEFYIDNLTYAIKNLLDILEIDKNFIIITDRLPINKDEKQKIKALKEGVAQYLDSKDLTIRYDIFHHCSASSVNLQIVDYISWAIFRKYEHGEDTSYKKIEKYLIKIDDMTKERDKNHYEK